MKTLIISTFLLTFWTNSSGQDGSDIRYIKPNNIDRSLIGQDIHFDFFNRSFGGRSSDTVTLIIDGRPRRFVELRKDNGHNNWFSQQSLQAIDKVGEGTTSISKFKLDSITGKSLKVTMYINYYDANGELLSDKSRLIQQWFDKKDIVEVLVKSK